MIDHNKILLPSTFHPSIWLKNSNMNFVGFTYIDSMDLLDKPIKCEIRGLTFTIKPRESGAISDIAISPEWERAEDYICEVSGSIHKYYNHGRNNSTLFTYSNVLEVFAELETLYNIPRISEIVTFEFGVNILLPNHIVACDFINGALLQQAASKHTQLFDSMGFGKTKFTGQVAKFDNFHSKLYDKGKQSGSNHSYLLRYEIKIKRSRYLETHNLKSKGEAFTIDMLLAESTFTKICELLECEFNRVIHIDTNVISYRTLTNYQQKKLIELQNPKEWVKFNHTQRYRQLDNLKEILQESTVKTPSHTIVSKLLRATLLEVMGEVGCVGAVLENVAFPSIVERGKHCNSETVVSGVKKECIVCSSDISSRSHTAKYCGKKCSNKITGKKRSKRNRDNRINEKINLKYLINNIESGEIYRIRYLYRGGLRHTVKDTTQIYKKDMPYSKYRRIVKVEILAENKIILTTMRAKEFIKLLSLINSD